MLQKLLSYVSSQLSPQGARRSNTHYYLLSNLCASQNPSRVSLNEYDGVLDV